MIDVDWGNGWVGVVSGEHLPVVIENHKQEFIKLRFTLNDWTGVAVIDIHVPVVPTEITTTFAPAMNSDLKSTDLALLYGVIFGALLVLCVLVLVVILSLKYVQFTRRENDKGLCLFDYVEWASHTHTHTPHTTHPHTPHPHTHTHTHTFLCTVSDDKEKEREYFRRMR